MNEKLKTFLAALAGGVIAIALTHTVIALADGNPTTDQVPKLIPYQGTLEKDGAGVTAYRVKGWPTDLADFDETPVATEKTILRSGNAFLFGATAEPTLDGAEGWFRWPVIDGQKICPSAEMVYCWHVAAVETGYALSFFTGPDEQTFELEPGTGIERFHYAHHGTTNEVEAKLVSYAKGPSR